MASLRVLTFDHEGRPVAFDTWHDDLQQYLLSDIKDIVSLFEHVSGLAPAPSATADAQALYDDVVARYSSPATTALGRMLLPYLFPELSAFATVADLVTHLRTSDARYRATVPTESGPRHGGPGGDQRRSETQSPQQLRIALAALGASASGTPPGTARAEALHTFTLDYGASRWSSMYTLTTGPPQVAASAQVSASGQVATSCSCRLQSHQTLLWHHRLGHPSLPHLCGRHSRFLVSGLPRSLPPLPPSQAPPRLPCVEGRQRAAPHSSFPPTTPPLQTLHMDVKGEVVDILIPWIRTVRLQLREHFSTDLLVLRLHSDRGGEFSSDLLRDLCRGEGILQSFTLPASPQQNGIA
ncbi:unnamed protein product [Closterium sp. NIES-53]